LVVLKELVEAGKVVPVIDKRYSLNEAPEALRYLGAGHARGKVVITVE
jgi:NADPH:quinone reductase-like Zn-dependent oxidoreductase